MVNYDLIIKNGKIKEVSVGKALEATADKEINAEGLHILPGLIDTHVHFNEPGNKVGGTRDRKQKLSCRRGYNIL